MLPTGPPMTTLSGLKVFDEVRDRYAEVSGGPFHAEEGEGIAFRRFRADKLPRELPVALGKSPGARFFPKAA